MNSRLRLLAWQIDVIAHDRSDHHEAHAGDARGHVAKWEGGGPQNRYERVRFSPWPKTSQRIRALIGNVGKREPPKSETQSRKLPRTDDKEREAGQWL